MGIQTGAVENRVGRELCGVTLMLMPRPYAASDDGDTFRSSCQEGHLGLAVCDETSVVAPDDYLGSDSFMQGAMVMQYGLSEYNAANHRWYYFMNMRMGEVLLYKQLDLNTALPGRLTFHTAFVDPTARPDAPV